MINEWNFKIFKNTTQELIGLQLSCFAIFTWFETTVCVLHFITDSWDNNALHRPRALRKTTQKVQRVVYIPLDSHRINAHMIVFLNPTTPNMSTCYFMTVWLWALAGTQSLQIIWYHILMNTDYYRPHTSVFFDSWLTSYSWAADRHCLVLAGAMRMCHANY